MNLEQLACIVEVAQCRSLTRAAQNRLMTVAGVSRSITMLEKELNIKIFIRSRSGVVQTLEGELVIQKAKKILKEVQELRTEVQSFSQMNSTKVRIGTIPGPITVLVDVLTQLKKEFPGLQFEIIEGDTVNLIRNTENGSLDAAFVLLSNVDQKYPNMYFDEIMEGNIVIGVSKSSSLANKQSVTPNDLKNHKFVLYDDNYISKLVAQFGEPIEILFRTNHVEAIHKAVKENIAATIATDYTLKGYSWIKSSNEIVMIPFNVPNNKRHYLYGVRSMGNSNNKVLNIFMTRVRQFFE